MHNAAATLEPVELQPVAIIPELLKDSQVAELLGLGRSSIWSMHSAGKLPRPVRLGGAVRWRRSELMAWLEAECPSRQQWEASRK